MASRILPKKENKIICISILLDNATQQFCQQQLSDDANNKHVTLKIAFLKSY